MLILIVCSLFTLFLYLIIDDHPQVSQVSSLDIASAQHTKQSLKRIYRSLKSSNNAPIILTTQEINSLLSLGHRAVPQIKANSALSTDVARLTVSIELPITGYYINASTLLYSSKNGIELGDTSLGSVSFSGNYLLKIFEFLLNFYGEGNLGTELFSTVSRVNISPSGLTLHYQLPDTALASSGNGLLSLMKLRDQWQIFGKANQVQFYFKQLAEFAEQNKSMTLIDYIAFVIEQAKLKSDARYLTMVKTEHSPQAFAQQENSAALTALVLYFGDDKFEWLIGNISKLSSKARKNQQMLRAKVTLNDRVDLQKHFVYSMALQLFANVAASDAIGEFKELIDANVGGSGFSFADLLADRAGTRFALYATKSEQHAQKVQQHFSLFFTEQDLMPVHLGLPEGIRQQDFNRLYLNTGSAAYRNMVENIDQRLMALNLYQ
ncbi:hypothetical protein [Thalassotalea sp. PLHSN55]|uniref:hypothetical protein n=1 Tax=Thalassotalea sp. PLHSN55 TaxID=3435888 RepID=UPI003F82B010